METSWKPHELPVFTRIYPYLPVLSALYLCVLTPLGSPTGLPKRSYVHVRGVPGPVVGPGCARAVVPGGCTRVGIQGGYTGCYTGVLPSR